jgi:hypothetical protein
MLFFFYLFCSRLSWLRLSWLTLHTVPLPPFTWGEGKGEWSLLLQRLLPPCRGKVGQVVTLGYAALTLMLRDSCEGLSGTW